MTLIEMLVTIAVIGIGVVGIAYGFAAVVRSSGDTQEQAALDGAARDAADYIQSTLAYSVCATPPYSLSGLSKPADVGAWRITSVSEASAPSLAGLPRPHRCGRRSSTAGYDYGVQEITFTVADKGLSVTQVVWKDDLPRSAPS